MKIAFITTSVIPSSTANSIQVMKVAHAHRALGQSVRLWAPDFGSASWEKLADQYGLTKAFEVAWLPFTPARKQYDFCWNAVRTAIEWGADVIYTWSLQAAVFALLQKRPVVMEFHDFPMGRIGPMLYRAWMRKSGKKLILTTTRALANGLEKRFGIPIPAEQLQIAPNGCDLERYARLPEPEQARRELGLAENFTVGYSGHFYAGRGMDLLIAIAIGLPDVSFLWVGGKPEDVQPWQQKLERENIRNVTITGFIPNSRLPLYQAAADVLVMPYGKRISGSSGGEISAVINPMKMFDYLAAGRALVASDIPVFREVLHEGIAVICPPDDSEAWIKAIASLRDVPENRARIGAQAKQEAVMYSWTRRASNTLDLFEKQLK
jgi:glycosyltransferase involved in cell wall biosynthesis